MCKLATRSSSLLIHAENFATSRGIHIKTTFVLSSAILACTLLTGCISTTEEPTEATSDASSAQPTEVVNPAAGGGSDLDSRVSALKDMQGNDLHLARAGDIVTGLDSARAAMEGTSVVPEQCKDIATKNMGSVNQLAGEGSTGTGVADDFGTVLSAGLVEAPSVTAAGEQFTATWQVLKGCASFSKSGAITTIEELPQDLIGDQSYAVLMAEEIAPGNTRYTLSVNARSGDLLTSVQSVGDIEPDGILHDELFDLATQLLKSPTP